MAQIHVATTQNVHIGLEAASVIHRAGAMLVDIVFGISGFLLLIVLADFLKDNEWLSRDAVINLFTGYVILYLISPLLMEALLDGQTLGKKIIGIRVVCLDGSRPTLGAYAIRWILGLVELVIASGSVAFLTVLLSRHNQRLGDMVAGTTVVRVKKPVTLNQLILDVPTDSTFIPIPEARYLTDADVQVIRDVLLSLGSKMKPAVSIAIMHRTVEGAEAKLGIVHNTLPEQFLQDVVASYGQIHGN